MGLEKAQKELAALQEFFAGVAPLTVNLDGIEKAVAEYYEWKSTVEKLAEKAVALEADSAAKRRKRKRRNLLTTPTWNKGENRQSVFADCRIF